MAYLFPHTAVPPWAEEALLALFDEVTVFQPAVDLFPKNSGPLVTRDRFNLLCPYENGHEDVYQAVKAHRQWADQHQGLDLKQLRSRLDLPAFFDEESTYHLETLIRPSEKGARSEKNFDPEQASLNSRLFLSLAQELDLRNWEMEANLEKVEAVEDRLFTQLHGEPVKTAFLQQKQQAVHATGYMIRERMEAWSFFLTQSEVLPSPWVAVCPEIIPLIEETVPAEKLLHAKGWGPIFEDDASRSQWRVRFKKVSDCWLNDPTQALDLSGLLLSQKASHENRVQITIYGVCDCDIIDWLKGSGFTALAGTGNLVVVVHPQK